MGSGYIPIPPGSANEPRDRDRIGRQPRTLLDYCTRVPRPFMTIDATSLATTDGVTR